MARWLNNDGLEIRLGNTEAEVVRGGELPASGTFRQIEFNLTLTTLTDASARVADTENILIPAGARITEVEVINEAAATGANATLNLGLVRQDFSTTYDTDGLLVAAPRTDWDTAGEKLVYKVGVTGAGALVGTTLANSGWLVADYETAAFTAGEVKIIIRFYIPRPAASN